VVVCKTAENGSSAQVLAMDDSDAKSADTVDESQTAVPAEEKKGWCMIASGGVAPVWGALFIILVAGLAAIKEEYGNDMLKKRLVVIFLIFSSQFLILHSQFSYFGQ